MVAGIIGREPGKGKYGKILQKMFGQKNVIAYSCDKARYQDQVSGIEELARICDIVVVEPDITDNIQLLQHAVKNIPRLFVANLTHLPVYELRTLYNYQTEAGSLVEADCSWALHIQQQVRKAMSVPNVVSIKSSGSTGLQYRSVAPYIELASFFIHENEFKSSFFFVPGRNNNLGLIDGYLMSRDKLLFKLTLTRYGPSQAVVEVFNNEKRISFDALPQNEFPKMVEQQIKNLLNKCPTCSLNRVIQAKSLLDTMSLQAEKVDVKWAPA